MSSDDISPEVRNHVTLIDRAMDRFLKDQLERDVALLREHGATEKEVKTFLAWKRRDYEESKSKALVEVIAFVTGWSRGDEPRRDLH